MPATVTTLDPADARAASGDHPLIAHLSAYLAPAFSAWQLGDAVAIADDYWGEPALVAVGPPDDAAALARALSDVECWLSLPADAAALLPDDVLDDRHEWAFRWIDRPTSTPADAARWLGPADDTALRELLATAFPDASVQPGSPRALRWAGRYVDGTLAAAAADATGAPGTGFVASIAVDADRRGGGLGRAVTGWLLDRLVERHGRAGLWVHGDNAPAMAVYDRLRMAGLSLVAGALPAAPRSARDDDHPPAAD